MNNFRKDELYQLSKLMETRLVCIGIDEFTREGSGIIWDKIQSMIDNYCDHDLASGCSVCSGLVGIQCIKCGIEL